MNASFSNLIVGALWSYTVMAPGNAIATTTGATASAFVNGSTVSQSFTAGPTGIQASANQTIPSPIEGVFVSAQASSYPGALRAAGVAKNNGSPGGFQAQASAFWSDSFVISAPGYDSSMTGTFSGGVQVTGGLLVQFSGRTYSDTQVYASVDIFPGTGFNGGRTTINGSARNLAGYDIPGINTGGNNFTLVFHDVPFTFDQRIDIGLSLAVTADVNAIDAGATGKSDANYSNTMIWSGLSAVRDQQGAQVPNYFAVSAGSGFNFANPTPVPEPESAALLYLGLLCVLWRSYYSVKQNAH